jgi:transposase
VIFSDESKFEICRNTHKVFVLKGEEIPHIGISNPPISTMIWGAISRKGKIGICFVNERINQHSYIEILKNNLLKSANSIYGKVNWRFQQDNAPCHKAKKVKEWLNDNVPRTIGHPPQSPDLNPIELIWAIMKNNVEKENPRNKDELIASIKSAWDSISKETINECINHIYEVMEYIKKNYGAFFK